MNTWQQVRRRVGNRPAVVIAGAVGFVLGAGGFAAAQIGPGTSTGIEQTAAQGADASRPVTSVTSASRLDRATDDTITDNTTTGNTISDDTITDDTITDDTITDNTITDNTISDDTITGNTITDDTITDNTTTGNTITDDTITDNTITDNTITDNTITDNTITDDTITGNTISDDTITDDTITDDTITDDTITDDIVTLPQAFTDTYTSAGGSITIAWSGTAFSLLAVSPASGFEAEIEQQSWDRIRVDFEHDEDDARIEVRLDGGNVRVRID